MAQTIASEDEVLSWFDQYSNWGRWGSDDMRGTLNFITESKRLSAAALVRDGITVSCARPVELMPSMDVPAGFAHRFMERSGDVLNATGASDSLLVSMHGGARTHLDSPCHILWNGKMFNGVEGSMVTQSGGAKTGAVDTAVQGIVSRGVLLDIARLKGRNWLEAGEAVFPEDLDDAEAQQSVQVGEGDILLVRTGHTARRVQDPLSYGSWPGLHAMCIPWLADRRVAALGTDSANDVSPSGYAQVGLPIHRVGIASMGLWLIDHCNHEQLTNVCARLNRWEFLFVVAPLNLPTMTGSLVNPIALL
jgi:kynurenine formamidase